MFQIVSNDRQWRAIFHFAYYCKQVQPFFGKLLAALVAEVSDAPQANDPDRKSVV